MKYNTTLFIIWIIVSSIFAQQTDIINNPSPPKSTRTAAMLSAVLPGTGQLYYGKQTKAGIFLATDIIVLGSFFRFQREKISAIDSYKQYAYVYAGLKKGSSPEFYRLAENYSSSEAYNDMIELNGRNYWLYYASETDFDAYAEYQEYVNQYKIPTQDGWEWQYESQRHKYIDIRFEKQHFELYQNLAFGALLLNRVISVLDTIIFSDKPDKAYSLYSVPDYDGKGIRLFYEYKF